MVLPNADSERNRNDPIAQIRSVVVPTEFSLQQMTELSQIFWLELCIY